MKRIIIISLLFVFIFSITGSAQDFAFSDMNFVGGITYNFFNGKYIDNGIVFENRYDLDKGIGINGGIQYWFLDNAALEAGFKSTTTSVDKAKISGPYSEMILKCNDWLNIEGGIAYYNLNFVNQYTVGSGLSYNGGISYLYEKDKKLSFVAKFIYHSTLINLDKEYGSTVNDVQLNMSGVSISGGVNINF